MSRWSENLMTLLDGRATMLETERGPIQVAREGDGPRVMSIHGTTATRRPRPTFGHCHKHRPTFGYVVGRGRIELSTERL